MMTIHLPSDLESSIQTAVLNGQFASVDDAMAAAAGLLLREISQHPAAKPTSQPQATGLGFIGALHDDADLLDQAVEHAMRVRDRKSSFAHPQIIMMSGRSAGPPADD